MPIPAAWSQPGPNWMEEWEGTFPPNTPGPATRWVAFWYQNEGHLTMNASINYMLEAYSFTMPTEVMYWSLDQMRARYEKPIQDFIDEFPGSAPLLQIIAQLVSEHDRYNGRGMNPWQRLMAQQNAALRQAINIGLEPDPTAPVYAPY